jgi:hypothetical protein
MIDLAGHAGSVFDTIFGHVDKPPSTPVADHAEGFAEWAAAHLVHPLNIYTAYPGLSVREIEGLAVAADVSGAGQQRPFLVILQIKSHLAFAEVKLLLLARGRGTTKDLDSVGTPHFAQFVPGSQKEALGIQLTATSFGLPSRYTKRSRTKRHELMIGEGCWWESTNHRTPVSNFYRWWAWRFQ